MYKERNDILTVEAWNTLMLLIEKGSNWGTINIPLDNNSKHSFEDDYNQAIGGSGRIIPQYSKATYYHYNSVVPSLEYQSDEYGIHRMMGFGRGAGREATLTFYHGLDQIMRVDDLLLNVFLSDITLKISIFRVRMLIVDENTGGTEYDKTVIINPNPNPEDDNHLISLNKEDLFGDAPIFKTISTPGVEGFTNINPLVSLILSIPEQNVGSDQVFYLMNMLFKYIISTEYLLTDYPCDHAPVQSSKPNYLVSGGLWDYLNRFNLIIDNYDTNQPDSSGTLRGNVGDALKIGADNKAVWSPVDSTVEFILEYTEDI